MAIETGAYVPDLNPANPPGSDQFKQGDDHLRLFKLWVKQSLQLFGAGLTTGGSSTVLTLTTGHSGVLSYLDGHLYAFALHTAIGIAATINVDGLGARLLTRYSNGAWVSMAADDFAINEVLLCYYEGGDTTMRVLMGSKTPLPLIGGTLTGNLNITRTSDDAAGVTLQTFAESTTPAVADALLTLNARGRDGAANPTTYGQLIFILADPTNTSEDCSVALKTLVAGASVTVLSVAGGDASFAQQLTSTGLLNALAGVGVTGTITVNAGGGVALRVNNTEAIQSKDNGGTYRTVLIGRFSDNILYLDGGASGMSIRHNDGSGVSIAMNGSGTVGFPSVGTTVNVGNAFLDSGAANNLLRSTSSARFKRDVAQLGPDVAMALLAKMRPVTYRSLASADDPDAVWYGFTAEDMATVDSQLVTWGYQDEDWEQYESARGEVEETFVDTGGKPQRRMVPHVIHSKRPRAGAHKVPDGVQYSLVTVIHTAVLQEMRSEINTLKAQMAKLLPGGR